MNSHIMETGENWKPKILLAGGTIGMAAGLIAAYLLIQRSEKEHHVPEINGKEGIRLGLLVFGLLREIAQLGDGK